MRLPTTAQTIASPRMVYLKGADVRFASNDEPEQFAGRSEPVQQNEAAGPDEVQRLRDLGLL